MSSSNPPPGSSSRRYFEVRNHAHDAIKLHLAYHTRTKSGTWQWFNGDFRTSWTIKRGKLTYLNHDDFKINADYVRFHATANDGKGSWSQYNETPLYIGEPGDPQQVIGDYTYTFWTLDGIHQFADKHTRRYLTVENGTSEPLKVGVGYHTQTKSGKWGWFDFDLKTGSWTLGPGERSLLTDSDGFVINANCIRIGASSPSGKTWGPSLVFIGDFTGDGDCHPKSSPYVYRFVSRDDDAHYNPATVESYQELARATAGRSFYAPNAAQLPGVIIQAVNAGLKHFNAGESADIALIIDTTGSMADDIMAVQAELNKFLDHLRGYQRRASRLRVGVVLYRDFGDEYLHRVYKFASDLEAVRNTINAIAVAGGGDEPEAVYDALHATLTQLDWSAQHRMGILIGDAPPHEISPEGHSKKTIAALARSRGVDVNLYPIIVGMGM
jgi:hypothetical protein